jgi:UDPglucose 6-dehydrogenase/GDP-mannose 6-dehydrogenase
MQISIVGCGYVGLVSGVCLAEKGHTVVCADVDQAKVDRINRGEPPIHESGLEDLLCRNLNHGFRATTDLREAVLNTDLTIIAVGTPFAGDEIDLRFIKEAALQIGAVLKEKSAYHVVLVKSTVVPGTTDDVVTPLLEKASAKRAGQDFGVGMNPEFLREGEAVDDFLSPDRIVMGAIDDRTATVLEDLYAPFRGVEKLRTNPRTAETIKYAANSLLATMISFSNEIGNLCAAIGDVDVVNVMRGVHLDKRLSPILADGKRITPAFVTYLEAGCGFGGSCFPKDLKALIAFGEKAGSRMRLLEAVTEVNRMQPQQVLMLLRKHFPVLAGVRVAVLGLAFKPGTDDVRESPAIPIVSELVAQQALVTTYDPVVKDGDFNGVAPNRYTTNLSEAVDNAQAILLLTRWPEFKDLPVLLSNRSEPPIVIDGRRLLDPTSVARYEGIGLRASQPKEESGVL